jgi:hypothetical protein
VLDFGPAYPLQRRMDPDETTADAVADAGLLSDESTS